VTSTRKLAAELTRQGHPVGADTVAALLKAEGFSLQGTSRTTEGVRHPDRDAQFRSSNGQVKEFTAARQQVISVDTKKQEVLGSYAVGGREWHRTGAAATGARPRLPRQERPEASALRQLRPGRLRRVGVGGLRWGYRRVRGRDLRRWWNGAGRHRDPAATRLLITADAGGERLPGCGPGSRSWPASPAPAGPRWRCCHVPPGTSKGNKIEHRLFFRISSNWRGRPLTSHEVVVGTIGATTTRIGLTAHAEFDPGAYPTGVTIPDEVMVALPLTAHDWHGIWNYTLRPEPPAPPPVPRY
jgi:hypothetical protein